jgi:hypothetical protein
MFSRVHTGILLSRVWGLGLGCIFFCFDSSFLAPRRGCKDSKRSIAGIYTQTNLQRVRGPFQPLTVLTLFRGQCQSPPTDHHPACAQQRPPPPPLASPHLWSSLVSIPPPSRTPSQRPSGQQACPSPLHPSGAVGNKKGRGVVGGGEFQVCAWQCCCRAHGCMHGSIRHIQGQCFSTKKYGQSMPDSAPCKHSDAGLEGSPLHPAKAGRGT